MRASPTSRHGLPTLALGLVLCLASCGPDGATAQSPELTWELTPRPARTGPARITFSLSDAGGAPLDAREVEVEANMSHPGMVPELAAASELAPGRYAAEFELSMGGDWFLLFRGRLADGSEFELLEELPGVQSE